MASGVFFKLPVQRYVAAVLMLLEAAAVTLLVGGNMLSIFALEHFDDWVILLGVALSLIGFGVLWVSGRLFLKMRKIPPDLVAIEGVHPDYLARLPEFPDSHNEHLFALL